jgi:hypothetical protein
MCLLCLQVRYLHLRGTGSEKEESDGRDMQLCFSVRQGLELLNERGVRDLSSDRRSGPRQFII